MRYTPQHVESVPFAAFDAKVKSLLTPAVQATGAITGTVVTLPDVPPASGIQAKVWIDTGAAVSSGLLTVPKIEQCATSGGSYEEVYAFPASIGATDHQEVVVTITKQFVKITGTITGTSLAASAGMMF
jgi:hypothetical protein